MIKDSRFVIYYRVSTKVQGDSGLGLEAQKSIIKHYITESSIEREFTEIASAKSITTRPVLQAALAFCLEHGCTLAVAKLDRLSRKTEDALQIFSQLQERLVSCDIPQLTKFTLTLFMAIADRERELIALRTKQALNEKKKAVGEWRRPGLGFRNPALLKKSLGTNLAKAQQNENNTRAASLICELRKQGMAWCRIAKKLNQDGFKTSLGKSFQAVQVQRIYKKYCLKQG